MFNKRIALAFFCTLVILNESCDSFAQKNGKTVAYSNDKITVRVPKEYIHQPIAFPDEQKENTGTLAIPLYHLVGDVSPENIDDNLIIFRIYLPYDKSIISISKTGPEVDRINKASSSGNMVINTDANGFKIITDGISNIWYITKSKPIIESADLIASCSKMELIEPNCQLPGFFVSSDVYVEGITLTESQLILHKKVKEQIKKFVVSWTSKQ